MGGLATDGLKLLLIVIDPLKPLMAELEILNDVELPAVIVCVATPQDTLKSVTCNVVELLAEPPGPVQLRV